MNNYHPNISCVIEVNPQIFSNTKFVFVYGIYKPMLHHQITKLSIDCSFRIPKRYKHYVFTEEIHRAKRISPNFQYDVKQKKKKFFKVNYSFS